MNVALARIGNSRIGNTQPQPIMRPSLRCWPDRVVGIPVALAIRCFAEETPRARFHENENPYFRRLRGMIDLPRSSDEFFCQAIESGYDNDAEHASSLAAGATHGTSRVAPRYCIRTANGDLALTKITTAIPVIFLAGSSDENNSLRRKYRDLCG